MRLLILISRIFVGVLFIISGLVKANDPLGLSYKMQEFFEVWTSSLAASSFFLKNGLMSLFQVLHEHSLLLSVIMITLEILAGVALLIGWKKTFILNLLLLLILFFTFLTGYALWSGKFKNCGCFGDCIPITPLASFLKDVVLLALILVLLAGQRYIQPLFIGQTRLLIMGLSLIGSLGFQWYVLNYLPVFDCLPFKKGNNISQQMQIPAGALPDSFAIRFVYRKDGKQFEFSPEQLPADLENYEFVDRVDKLIRKGNAEPPIKGFALVGASGTDSTSIVLNEPAALILFSEHFRDSVALWMEDFRNVVHEARSKNIPVYIATSASMQKAVEVFAKNGLPDVPIFATDNTAVKTAARTNPTLYLIQKGTIQEKYSYRQMREGIEKIQRLKVDN